MSLQLHWASSISKAYILVYISTLVYYLGTVLTTRERETYAEENMFGVWATLRVRQDYSAAIKVIMRPEVPFLTFLTHSNVLSAVDCILIDYSF